MQISENVTYREINTIRDQNNTVFYERGISMTV